MSQRYYCHYISIPVSDLAEIGSILPIDKISGAGLAVALSIALA
jgi:hypothetical protein